jgi:spermidine/putrescine transport system permease protein
MSLLSVEEDSRVKPANDEKKAVGQDHCSMTSRSLPYVLTLPSGIIFFATFVAPFLYFFVISFWIVDFFALTPAATLANYREIYQKYVPVAVYTVMLATVTAVLTVAIGFLYSFIARFKLTRWADFLLFVVLITMFGGYLMKIYAWKTILGNEGVLNTALMASGIIDAPISALLYSPGAVVVTLLHFALPFAVLPTYAAMRAIRDSEIEVARDLGASPLETFSTIIVPRCRAGIVTAFSFSFLITAGDYVTPVLVGGKQTLIGNLIAPQFGSMFNWPLGAAMSFVMLAASVAVIWAFSRATAWWCRL